MAFAKIHIVFRRTVIIFSQTRNGKVEKNSFYGKPEQDLEKALKLQETTKTEDFTNNAHEQITS